MMYVLCSRLLWLQKHQKRL